MARAVLTVVEAVNTGTLLSGVAGTDQGTSFANDGKTVLIVTNADAGGAHTIVIQTPATVKSLAVGENTVSITESTSKLIGPFATDTFNQSNATVYVDFEAGEEAHLSCQAFRVTKKA
jgi:hypothetical protein